MTGGNSTTSSPGKQPSEPSGGDAAWCVGGDADASEVEVTFGAPAAAKDEWASDLGLTWRHYIPVTLTNKTEKPCRYTVDVTLAVDGTAGAATEVVSAQLDAGQTFVAQAFDLDKVVKFSADAQDATTTSTVEPSVASVERAPVIDYYDVSVAVGDRSGSGASTLISADLDFKAVRDGVPERLPSAKIDYVYLQGLDADGKIVTITGNSIDEPKVPGTQTVQFAIGGGDSNGYNRNLMPLSAYDSVVDWQIRVQPAYTDLDR
ncbi:hypothetical protein ACTVCO_02830 [Sanguibacter sp. A247]|uniref:hypothetical protein n=1 Tax=unclassified Sanguibacter TaxID=2645534 RepID=UPI003FD8CE7E